MPVLFRGDVFVHYWQLYLESRLADHAGRPFEAFAGQRNGLCGAAVPGLLFLRTGLHTGDVEVTVEAFDGYPPIADEWEDVVEVSFQPASERVLLSQWAGRASWPLRLQPLEYRVRYCASGLDAARDQDTRVAEGPRFDRYLLQLWPAPPAPDAVLRQTSHAAQDSHTQVAALPPSSPQPRAEAPSQRLPTVEERRRQEVRWGGPLPDERVRQTNGALSMARLDRGLVDALAAVDRRTQRAVAIWAAHRACTLAGLANLSWVSTALRAVANGDSLPPPFTSYEDARAALNSDTSAPRTTVTSYNGRREGVPQQEKALQAVFAAAAADSLEAALTAVFYTVVTCGTGYPPVLDDVRREFPTLRQS